MFEAKQNDSVRSWEKSDWINQFGEKFWARISGLNQPARIQKELEMVNLLRSKASKWQVYWANKRGLLWITICLGISSCSRIRWIFYYGRASQSSQGKGIQSWVTESLTNVWLCISSDVVLAPAVRIPTWRLSCTTVTYCQGPRFVPCMLSLWWFSVCGLL